MKPVVSDVVAAVGATLAAGVAASQRADSRDITVPIGVAGVFGASAIYGTVQVKRCRAEHEKRPGLSIEDVPAVM